MTAPRFVAVRLWCWAVLLRPLKHVVPFRSLVRFVRTRARHARSPEFERQLEAYMDALGRFPHRAPANCLERSLGAYRLLCASGSSPEVIVGIRRHETLGIEGHVWVTVDGRALAEPPAFLSTFTTLVTYDADGHQRVPGGSTGSLAGVRFA